MNPTSFLYFLTVRKTCSFSKAAELLYISPQESAKHQNWRMNFSARFLSVISERADPDCVREILKKHAQIITEEYALLRKDLSNLTKGSYPRHYTGRLPGTQSPLLKILQEKYPDFSISYIESWIYSARKMCTIISMILP